MGKSKVAAILKSKDAIDELIIINKIQKALKDKIS